jgi:hypothetical protein
MFAENETGDLPRDVEKQEVLDHEEQRHTGGKLGSVLAVKAGEVYESHPEKNSKWYQRLLDSGFEENGVKPVPLQSRTSTSYNGLFTIFFTSLLCLLP